MMSLLKILFHHAVIISPTFHTSALPYKISNSTFARRQFRFQLRSCLASDVNTISGRIVHLHNWLAKVTRVETVHTTLQEGSMKNFTGLFASVLLLVVGTTLTAFSQTVIFSEDFETGSASSQWGVYYRQPGTTLAEDSVKAVPMAQAPAALAGGGNYVGWLQDLDGTYTGSAVAVAGFTGLQDYSIEADVYVYVGASASSYTGLVVYADSSKKEFYKLRADLDASNRVNLSNLKSNPSTFAPYFNKDFTVAQNPGLFPTVSGWHKMKLEVRTTSVDSITIWSYFDGTLIANNPVKDTARMTSGQFGLYSFKQSATGLAAYFDNIVVKTLPGTSTAIFSEDFETGTASSQWGVYYRQPGTTLAEDSVKAVPMAQAPAALAGGGNYVGWLQDLDGTYTGSAVAVAGFTGLQDYSIEADVYVYVGASASSYTGLVVYADSSKKEFYKLRADLDASNRVNLSNLKSNPSTFAPYFNKDFTVAQNPGLFPTVSGWHKMKLEVRTTSVDSITIWSYFDGTLIANNPVKDTARMTSGQFGLYSFKQSATGLAAYFDNIVVKTLVVTGVGDVTEDQDAPRDFGLAQNYPNPFNPATVIQYRLSTASVVDLRVFDLLGREVAVLATGERSAGTHNVEFDASRLPSGMYLYRLSTGEFTQTKKMLLTK